MIRILPKFTTKAEEDLKRLVWKIANENNIKISFVNDSISIKEGIDSIVMGLVHIFENAHGEFDEATLKEFAELKKAMKKKPTKRIGSPNNFNSKKKGHSGGSNNGKKS